MYHFRTKTVSAAPAAVPVVAAKPAYSTPTYTTPQAIRQNTVIKPQQATASANTYSAYASQTTSAATSSGKLLYITDRCFQVY